ncbi:YceI family protein [Zunongwangia sp. H14]|uniref:YceI family protein n=1 Tax=Zunongwangia sp. H14 TaxID=3240792 RepID=UPI003566DBE4
MKNAILLFLLGLATSTCFSQQQYEQKTVQILPESVLNISGDTNISAFHCEFDTSLLKGKHEFQYSEETGSIYFKNAVLNLENKGFDCGNRAINKDFNALMQTEKYPGIKLELKKVSFDQEDNAMARVNIIMAGIEKNYIIPVTIINCPTPNYKGSLHLNIKDFGLEPPRKFFGLIVIKDDIEINFNLVVKPQK